MVQKPWFVKCMCRGSEIEFRSHEPFTEESVEKLFCPVCVKKADIGTVLVRMNPQPHTSGGVWGVLYNKEELKDKDEEFEEGKEYLIRLFQGGDIIFNFIPEKAGSPQYQILGVKDERSIDQFLQTTEHNRR